MDILQKAIKTISPVSPESMEILLSAWKEKPSKELKSFAKTNLLQPEQKKQ